MEHWLVLDIEYIYNNRVVKINIVVEVEFESTRRSTIPLAVGIVFG
jgi:hypothetical protein